MRRRHFVLPSSFDGLSVARYATKSRISRRVSTLDISGMIEIACSWISSISAFATHFIPLRVEQDGFLFCLFAKYSLHDLSCCQEENLRSIFLIDVGARCNDRPQQVVNIAFCGNPFEIWPNRTAGAANAMTANARSGQMRGKNLPSAALHFRRPCIHRT